MIGQANEAALWALLSSGNTNLHVVLLSSLASALSSEHPAKRFLKKADEPVGVHQKKVWRGQLHCV
jgi:hypothetical protein